MKEAVDGVRARTGATSRILRFLPLDRDTRSMGIVLGAHGIRLALGLVSSILLARALGPEGLGVFALLGATTMIGVALADLGLSESAVRHLSGDLIHRPPRAPETSAAFAWMKLLGGTAVAVLLVLLDDPLLALLGLSPHTPRVLVWLAAAGVLATTSSGVFSTILQSRRQFPGLLGVQATNSGVTVILMALLFVAGRLTVATGLVVGAIAALAAGFFGWRLVPADWRRALARSPFRRSEERNRLWRFGRWLWVSTVLAIVVTHLDLLLLNGLATSRQAGHYALALNLALKAAILHQAMRVVLLPRISRLGRQEFRAYARGSLTRSLILVALLALTVPLVKPLLVTFYGPAFEPAADPLYVLLAVVAFDLLALPLLLLAFPLDAPRLIAASQGVQVVVLLAGGLYLIPLWEATGAAAAKLIAHVLGAIFLGIALCVRLWQRPG